ncbi:uncharacterized protein LOC142163967 [Nicotiana tabacum]|uniref:Uncharacterized protein LOC142163967 n=1 Tax=Nicotiana tabacum TaxID=4097 RepID=A0AC58RWW2_TOBAC
MVSLPVPMKVVVANGQVMYSDTICLNFQWTMQGELFSFHMRLLKVGGCDLVLGMDWIDQVAKILINTKPNRVSFRKDGNIVTLIGSSSIPSLKHLEDEEQLGRLLAGGDYDIVVEVCLVSNSPATNSKLEQYTKISALLQQYSEVFKEPTEMPPQRECDYIINLFLGARPFNLRPYRYSHDQKDVVEAIISDMLHAKTVVPSQSAFVFPALLVKKKDLT